MPLTSEQVNSDAQSALRADLVKPQTPVVRRIDLDDQSISEALRRELVADFEIIRSASEAVQQDLSYFLGRHLHPAWVLSLVKGAERSQQVARDVVREMLDDVAGRLKDAALRDHFRAANLSERERLSVLAHASRDDIRDVLTKLVDASHANKHVRRFLQGKFNNALQFADQQTRGELMLHILKMGNRSLASEDLAAVMQWSRTLNELSGLVETCGQDRLLAMGGQQIRELVALAKIGTAMRAFNVPVVLSAEPTCEELESALSAIETSLNDRLKILKSFQEFAGTATIEDYISTAHYELEYLQAARNGDMSAEQMKNLAELMLAKLDVEFRYGMTLMHETSAARIGLINGEWQIVQVPGRHWSVEEVHDVRKTLERLPEGLVLTTPLLRVIQRVQSLGYGVLGQRFPNGLIKIADFAVDNPYVARFFPGISSLEVTLTHEIGHGVQIADQPQAIEGSQEQGYRLAPGDPRYDFAEYMALSGWCLIAPERFEITNHGLSVKLDGEEYAIGRPIKHQGQEIILVLNQGLLFSHKAYAPFSLIDYSRTNPWEDWAEAFTEYFLSPRRLITFAPEKFRYFEEEFGVYSSDAQLNELLAQHLAKRDEKYRTQPQRPDSSAAPRLAANLE